MRIEAADAPRLPPHQRGWWGGLVEALGGGFRLRGWASGRVIAGVTDRSLDVAQFLRALHPAASAVEAEQVHGASLAVIAHPVTTRVAGGTGPGPAARPPVPGCDALLTHVAGTALLVRTADCLPIFFAEPRRGVVGLAHVGWRGLAVSLPARMVAAFRHVYHVPAEALCVAIGPAIRACCYEVGPEFAERFGPFVRERGGRLTCDLVGAACEELVRCGVRPDRVADTGACTACDVQRWFSLRQEGPSTGRLTSVIMVR